MTEEDNRKNSLLMTGSRTGALARGKVSPSGFDPPDTPMLRQIPLRVVNLYVYYFLAWLWVCTACGNTVANDGTDKALSDASISDAAAQEPEVGSAPQGVTISQKAPECDDAVTLDLSFGNKEDKMKPYLLDFVNPSECESLIPEVFIQNTGSTAVTIDEMVIGPIGFAVEDVDLPWNIPAGGFSPPVKLSFTSKEARVTEGALVLNGQRGCGRIELSGNAVGDGGLFSSNVETEVYFGKFLPGESSTPKEISYLYQDAEDPDGLNEIDRTLWGEPVVYSYDIESGEAKANWGAFTMVSFDGDIGPLENCEEHRVSIVFTAPNVPGRYEGALVYGIGAATFLIILYGETVES